jgi:hypothetical protein
VRRRFSGGVKAVRQRFALVRRRTVRWRWPQAVLALPNEGGRRSTRGAFLGQSGHTDQAAAGPEWAEWADAGREQSYSSGQNR